MNLKQKILSLKQSGLTQAEIAIELNCSTGTVSYHCNPNVKKKAIENKRLKRQLTKSPNLSPFINKEISVKLQTVNWKYAEAICNARLIELGYETFLPTVSGGEIDVIAYKDNVCYRVQIKSISPTNTKSISINLHRKSGSYNNPKEIKYTNIDFFLVYDGTNIYKITKEISILRYKIPSNCQVDRISMAYDFIF